MNNSFRKSALASAVAAVLAAPVAGFAQDEEKIEEEIVVKGIRGSLGKALNIKKESVGFVDAISAEDIGKLPDQNLAEALQRVPGVAIQRDRGEGNFVSIRGLGPEFTQALVNGRTIVTGEDGRVFNFDVLPSEIIRTTEVIKTPEAALQEGGIGGTVNLRTARPLELGSTYAFSAQINDNDLSESSTPRVSGMGSWVNSSETAGLLVSLSYSEQDAVQNENGSFGYADIFNVFGVNGAFGTAFDTDGDGLADVAGDSVDIPFANVISQFDENRERTTLVSSFQWQPDDNTDLVVDLLYSDFETDENTRQVIVLTHPLDLFGGGTLRNPDDSLTVTELAVGSDGVLDRFSHAGFNNVNVGGLSQEDVSTILFGANLTKRFGDWEVSGDISYSSAEFDQTGVGGNFDFNRLGPGGASDFYYAGTLEILGDQQLTTAPGIDFSNPALYSTQRFNIRQSRNEDEELGFVLDAKLNIESGFVDAIKIGTSARFREKNRSRFGVQNFQNFGVGSSTALVDGIFVRGDSNFLSGSTIFDESLFPNPQAGLDYVIQQGANGPSAFSENTSDSFDVEEEVFSAYFQLDFGGDLGTVSYQGNLGFRLAHTQVESVALLAPFDVRLIPGGSGQVREVVSTGDSSPFSGSTRYTNLLPSLNVRFELSDNLYLRTAVGETVTRPDLERLSPLVSVTNATQLQASGGNPELEPFESTSYDLALEYYWSDASAATFGVFFKDIGNFIAFDVSQEVIFGNNLTVSRPRNQQSAEVVGFEAGFQHAFDNGFGFLVNYTYADSTATFAPSDQAANFAFALEGISENTYNAVVYYDEGPLQARLAYNFRSDFLQGLSGTALGTPLFTDDYQQLDFSASYDVNDSLSVFIEAINLTDEQELQFDTIAAQPFALSETGRRVGIGVRASF